MKITKTKRTFEYTKLKAELSRILPNLAKHQIEEIRTLVHQTYVKRFKRSRIPKYGNLNKGFTDYELQKFFKVIDNDKFRLLFSYQAQLGLRIGEAVKLNIKDINLQTRELTLKTEKASASKLPYLKMDYVRNRFRYYVEQADTDQVYDISDESYQNHIPWVAVYRFMVAIARTGSITEAYGMLREKGWLTSLASLYGGKRKPSILSRAISSGYVNQEGRLTEKGNGVVNPERIIAKQGIYSGSEEHKELMRKTIRMIQDRGNFAFTLSDKDSFDVGELKAKMRRVWDYEDIEVYECQTNALPDELNKCIERAGRLGAGMTFVASSDEIANAIRESTRLPCIILR